MHTGKLGITIGALALTACAHATRQAATPAPAMSARVTAPAPAGTATDAAGTWRLVSIDGHALPYTPTHEGGAPEVRASTMTLNADGSFTTTMTFALPDGRVGSRNLGGTWSREGSEFTFLWTGAGRTTGTLDDGMLTMTNEGIAFEYRR